LDWQKKIRHSISCRSKNQSRQFFIRTTGELAKPDNVKSSAERQVKERHFYIELFLLFVCFFAEIYRAGVADPIFVDSNERISQ
jgi:hypothetical protein